MIKRRKRQIRSHENIIPRNRNENWTRTPTCSQLNAPLPVSPPLILPLLILGRNMKLVATPLSLSAQQLIALIMQILLEAEASIPSQARSVVKPMHEFILILREMSNFNNLPPLSRWPLQDIAARIWFDASDLTSIRFLNIFYCIFFEFYGISSFAKTFPRFLNSVDF